MTAPTAPPREHALRAFVTALHGATIEGLRSRLSAEISVLGPPAPQRPSGPTLVVVLRDLRPGPAGLVVRFAVWVWARTALEADALRAAVGVAFGRDPHLVHGPTRLRVDVKDEEEDLVLELTTV